MASKIISNDNSATPSSSGSNSYIKRLLKTYLQSAESSLSGPDRATRAAAAIKPTATAGAGAAAVAADVGLSPASTQPGSLSQPTPISSSPVKSLTKNLATSPSYRVPVFLPKDESLDSQRKADTVVCGKMVACFDIGGEMRICVPDLLNKVLHDVTIDDINAACDKLCVHCSQCSDAQMAALISAGVLPAGTVSAGLMTKSQAERLCRYVFEHKYGAGPSGLAAHRLESSGAARGISFMVYHECFGKCKGVFYADRYSHPTAACIECCQCSCLMSPEEFVCHGHHGQELRTCHWGFDASHWRSYLLVARDHCEDIAPLQAHLEELKARFKNKEKAIRINGQSDTAIPATPPPSSTLTSNLKRKDAVVNMNPKVLLLLFYSLLLLSMATTYRNYISTIIMQKKTLSVMQASTNNYENHQRSVRSLTVVSVPTAHCTFQLS